MRPEQTGAMGCVLAALCGCVQGRAPLVSLTVGILTNATGSSGSPPPPQQQQQAIFDRSDYAYPLPQTGLDTFDFTGELYVPAAAECADDVVGQDVRTKGAQIERPNGIAFLPYRSCRGDWEQLLSDEAAGGRAAGALLYSLKDDAAQAAELTVVDADSLRIPVWMVNAVAGEYLATVLQRVYQDPPVVDLPRPPNNVQLSMLRDSAQRTVRIAPRSASSASSPRVYVAISRSATDVTTQDRNFFLKAMVGVGITGIVCFFIAILVRYFDCMSSPRHQQQQRQRRRRRHEVPGLSAADLLRQAPRAAEKRVLQRHELDQMPCTVVRNWRPPPAHVPWRAVSCPHLPTPRGEDLAMHRIHSTQDATALIVDAPNGWTSDGNECAICLDDIGIGDVVRTLPCPHVFHARCIDRWLLFQSSVCPLCKRDTIHA